MTPGASKQFLSPREVANPPHLPPTPEVLDAMEKGTGPASSTAEQARSPWFIGNRMRGFLSKVTPTSPEPRSSGESDRLEAGIMEKPIPAPPPRAPTSTVAAAAAAEKVSAGGFKPVESAKPKVLAATTTSVGGDAQTTTKGDAVAEKSSEKPNLRVDTGNGSGAEDAGEKEKEKKGESAGAAKEGEDEDGEGGVAGSSLPKHMQDDAEGTTENDTSGSRPSSPNVSKSQKRKHKKSSNKKKTT